MIEQPQSPQQRADDDLALLHADRTRRSRIAIIAFLLALVLSFPIAGGLASWMGRPELTIPVSLAAGGAALIAAILGVIGILHTRKRRRRGRALAILAVILGLIGTIAQPGVGYSIKMLTEATRVSVSAVRILGIPHDRLAMAAPQWRDKYGSEDLRELITPETFTVWLETIVTEHGQLQSVEKTSNSVQQRARFLEFRYTGRFVNGSAIIKMVVAFDSKSGKPMVDNIFVNDSSPRD